MNCSFNCSFFKPCNNSSIDKTGHIGLGIDKKQSGSNKRFIRHTLKSSASAFDDSITTLMRAGSSAACVITSVSKSSKTYTYKKPQITFSVSKSNPPTFTDK